jgi:hypothetical protein
MDFAGFELASLGTPFRMQPGLRRLAPGARQLTPLAAGSPLWHEKKAVLDAGASRLAVPGFDARPVVDAILAKARAEGIPPQEPLELALEEDFALLDGATGTLPWVCICVPSHWAPEGKLGQPFAAVHAPVADNRTLLAAAPHLVQLATSGESWERFVWTLTPSGRFDQHPARHPRTPWPAETDPQALASRTFLRVERQTFFPLSGETPRAVFTIRVMIAPLELAVAAPAEAAALHGALGTMSEAVLAYKSLAPARDRLLAWLAARMR